ESLRGASGAAAVLGRYSSTRPWGRVPEERRRAVGEVGRFALLAALGRQPLAQRVRRDRWRHHLRRGHHPQEAGRGTSAPGSRGVRERSGRIVIADLDGIIVTANPAFRAISEYSE